MGSPTTQSSVSTRAWVSRPLSGKMTLARFLSSISPRTAGAGGFFGRMNDRGRISKSFSNAAAWFLVIGPRLRFAASYVR